MQEEKLEGVVLRTFEYGERQRILTLFTPQAGMVSLIMKKISLKKPHLLALSTPPSRGEFVYLKGRSELLRFQEGSVLDAYSELRCSKYSHLNAAMQLTESIVRSQLPGKPSPALYALLIAYLEKIASFPDPLPLSTSFRLKLLRHEGLLTPHSFPSYFSREERTLLQNLLTCRHFGRLQEIPVSAELSGKIERYFIEKIR